MQSSKFTSNTGSGDRSRGSDGQSPDTLFSGGSDAARGSNASARLVSRGDSPRSRNIDGGSNAGRAEVTGRPADRRGSPPTRSAGQAERYRPTTRSSTARGSNVSACPISPGDPPRFAGANGGSASGRGQATGCPRDQQRALPTHLAARADQLLPGASSSCTAGAGTARLRPAEFRTAQAQLHQAIATTLRMFETKEVRAKSWMKMNSQLQAAAELLLTVTQMAHRAGDPMDDAWESANVAMFVARSVRQRMWSLQTGQALGVQVQTAEASAAAARVQTESRRAKTEAERTEIEAERAWKEVPQAMAVFKHAMEAINQVKASEDRLEEEFSKSKGLLEAWSQLNMSAADAEEVAKIVADAEAMAKIAANVEGIATVLYEPAREATEAATAAIREASGKVAAYEQAARAAKARAKQAEQAARAAAQEIGEQPFSGGEEALRRLLGQGRTWEHAGATGAAVAA
jgi:hypothetical protein